MRTKRARLDGPSNSLFERKRRNSWKKAKRCFSSVLPFSIRRFPSNHITFSFTELRTLFLVERRGLKRYGRWKEENDNACLPSPSLYLFARRCEGGEGLGREGNSTELPFQSGIPLKLARNFLFDGFDPALKLSSGRRRRRRIREAGQHFTSKPK